MDAAEMEAVASRRARLPDEPIYCAAPDRPEDVIYYGSDHELDEDAQAENRARYEEQAMRYLKGQKPLVFSSALRGPFDRASGWKNPWLPKEPKPTKQTTAFPAKPSYRPAVKESFTRAVKKLQEPASSTPVTKSPEPFCHLPSPVSNRDLQQLGTHDHLDNEKLTRIRSWAESVPRNGPVLEKDRFWAPSPASNRTDGNKRRLSGSEWLKTDLKRMKPSATQPKQAPTPTHSSTQEAFNRAGSAPTTTNNPRRQVAAIKYASFGITKTSAWANANQVRRDPFKLLESKDSAGHTPTLANRGDIMDDAAKVDRPNSRLASYRATPSSQQDAMQSLPVRSFAVKEAPLGMVDSQSPLKRKSPGRTLLGQSNQTLSRPNQTSVTQKDNEETRRTKPNTPFSERRQEPVIVATNAPENEQAPAEHKAPTPTKRPAVSAASRTTRLHAPQQTSKIISSPVARRTRSRQPKRKHVTEGAASINQPQPSATHGSPVSATSPRKLKIVPNGAEIEDAHVDCSSSLSSLPSSVDEEQPDGHDEQDRHETDAMSLISSSSLSSTASISNPSLETRENQDDKHDVETMQLDCSSSLSSACSIGTPVEAWVGDEETPDMAENDVQRDGSGLYAGEQNQQTAQSPSQDDVVVDESMILGASVDQHEVAMEESMVLGTTDNPRETVMQESVSLGVTGPSSHDGDQNEHGEESMHTRDVNKTVCARSPSKSDGGSCGGAERQLLFESVQHAPLGVSTEETGYAGSSSFGPFAGSSITEAAETEKVKITTSEHGQQNACTMDMQEENNKLSPCQTAQLSEPEALGTLAMTETNLTTGAETQVATDFPRPPAPGKEIPEQNMTCPEIPEARQDAAPSHPQPSTTTMVAGPSGSTVVEGRSFSLGVDEQTNAQGPYLQTPSSVLSHSIPVLGPHDSLATPQAVSERECTPEAEFTIRSFAEFNTPSPKRRISRPKSRPSSHGLRKSILVVGGSLGSRDRVKSGRRVSFAPLPDNKDAEVDGAPSMAPRAASPPPQTTRADWNEDMDTLKWDDNMGRFFSPGGFDPKKLRSVRDGLPSDTQPAPVTGDLPRSDIGATEQEAHEPDDEAEGIDVVDDVLGNIDDFLGGVWDVDAEAAKASLEPARDFHGGGMAGFSLAMDM